MRHQTAAFIRRPLPALPHQRRRLTQWLAAAAALGLAACSSSPTHRSLSAPLLVATAAGPMRGASDAGVDRYLGIPYAAAPVGDLRWRPPQAPAPWVQPLDATQFGKTCAQPQRGVFSAPSNDEDCLNLNVFTPSGAKGSGAKRPVMVWLHGGGLYSGESRDYDGSKLATRGNVVVVTVNYRVGALGFLSHPALNAEGHAWGNYGIMDQQFALQWVRRNIEAFGGDPANVTLFGQSGGATAVMAHLQSPLSTGLFHKAINQSGTRIAVTPPATALELGRQFAVATGCADQSAACLRSLTVQQVLANQAGVVSKVSDFPAVDGTVITQSALAAFSSGRYNRVPILTGLVLDEQAFFLPELNTGKPRTLEDYKRYAGTYGAAHVQTLMNRYPAEAYASPSLAEIAMAQGAKACTARLLNQQWVKYAPLYAYQFEDRTAPSYFKPVSYPMRAYHTAELQYLFPMFRGGQGTATPLNAAQQVLSDAMVDYWTTFARTGNPNPGGAKAPATWAPYTAASDNIQVLDLPAPRPATGYGVANDCRLWDGILSFK